MMEDVKSYFDYVRAGNYWRWLKKKLNTEGVQLVSVTHEFKFEAPDGKQRAAPSVVAEAPPSSGFSASQMLILSAAQRENHYLITILMPLWI